MMVKEVRLLLLIAILMPLTSYNTYPAADRVAKLKPVSGVLAGLVKLVKVIVKVYELKIFVFRNEPSRTVFDVTEQAGVLMFDALFMAVMLIPLQTVELLAADICWLNSDGNSIRIWSFVIKFVITTVVTPIW